MCEGILPENCWGKCPYYTEGCGNIRKTVKDMEEAEENLDVLYLLSAV
jgi:hypothetical protein